MVFEFWLKLDRLVIVLGVWCCNFCKKNIQKVKSGPVYTEFWAWHKNTFRSTRQYFFIYNSIFWPPWLRNFILKTNFPKVNMEFGSTISRWGGGGCCRISKIFRIRFKFWREFAAKTVQNRTWVLLSCCGTGTTAVPVPVQLENTMSCTGRSAVFELQIQILEFCERRRSSAVERCVTLPYRLLITFQSHTDYNPRTRMGTTGLLA